MTLKTWRETKLLTSKPREQGAHKEAVYMKAAKYWNRDEMALRLHRVSGV